MQIRIQIEGVTIPLNVSTVEQEKMFRDAAVRIQQHLQQLRKRYPNVPSEQYYYAMAMLDNTIEVMQSQQRQDTAPFVKAIEQLGHDFDKALNA